MLEDTKGKLRIKINKMLYFVMIIIMIQAICVFGEDPDEDEDRSEPHPNPKSLKTSMYELNVPIRDILWLSSCFDGGVPNNPNAEVMIVHTIQGEAYKSSDRGVTWQSMHKVNNTKSSDVLIPSTHKINSIILSPADPKLVYLIGNKGRNWVSEDCGAHLKPLNDAEKIQDIRFHPTQREWAISSIYKSCDDFSDEDCYFHKEIFVTTNLGKTWKKLEENVKQYDWGKQSAEDKVPDEQIILVKAKGKEEIESSSWSENNDIIISEDFFKTKKVLLKGGNYFKITNDYLYAGKVTPQGTKVLTRALKKYQYQNFFDMEISKKNQHQFDFSVIESVTGAVFLFVARPGKIQNSGNIYLSDATGTGFTLNLERVPFANSFEYDFDEIKSLEGVIIANTFDQDNIGNSIDDKSGKSKSNKFSRNSETDVKRKTYISFNRGGKWQSLTPPAKSSKGKIISCRIENGCSLHLHSLTSDRYPFPYSIQNGVGIIVGVGNTGQYLQYDDNKLNTYISRDGGVTWFEIIKGPHVFRRNHYPPTGR